MIFLPGDGHWIYRIYFDYILRIFVLNPLPFSISSQQPCIHVRVQHIYHGSHTQDGRQCFFFKIFFLSELSHFAYLFFLNNTKLNTILKFKKMVKLTICPFLWLDSIRYRSGETINTRKKKLSRRHFSGHFGSDKRQAVVGKVNIDFPDEKLFTANCFHDYNEENILKFVLLNN